MSESIISRVIGEIKDTMAVTAESAMLQQFDPVQSAVIVGKYRGLKEALDIIDAILRDNLEKERNS